MYRTCCARPFILCYTVILVTFLSSPSHAGSSSPCPGRPIQGDVNCDGVFNNFDIDPFLLAIIDPAGYAVAFPNCPTLNADINGDGLVNNFDIDPFVTIVVTPPVLVSDPGGPYVIECTGPTAQVALSGICSYSVNGDPLQYLWSSDCPNASFTDPTSANTVMTFSQGAGCPTVCNATLMVIVDLDPPPTVAGGGPRRITATRTTTVTLADTTPPQLMAPPNATVECGQPTDPQTLGSAEAVDTCSGPLTPTFNDVAANGAITRAWTATDACGNSVSAVQVITVSDTTPPQITCPANVQVQAAVAAGVPVDSVTLTASATDTCPGPLTITDNRPAGNYPVGMTTVTFSAADGAGNKATCSMVVDVLAPPPPIDNGNSNNNSNSNSNSNNNSNSNANGNGNSNGNSNANSNANGNDSNRPPPVDNGNSGGNQNGNDSSLTPPKNYQEEYLITVTRTPLCGPIGFAPLFMSGLALAAVRAGLRRRFGGEA